MQSGLPIEFYFSLQPIHLLEALPHNIYKIGKNMIESLDCGPNDMQRDSTAHAYFSLVVTKIDAKQKKPTTTLTSTQEKHIQ